MHSDPPHGGDRDEPADTAEPDEPVSPADDAEAVSVPADDPGTPAGSETAEHAALEDDAAASAIKAPPDTGAFQVFQQRARLAEDRLTEVLGAYRALKTETEAHRERTTRNLERRFAERHDKLLGRFIEILDNLDRALEAAEKAVAEEAMIQGLILVRTQLLHTLKDEGLERIPVLGLPYDPHTSEVLGTDVVSDPDQHHVVVKELMRGYRLNGRVARPARVVVGEYQMPLGFADDPES